MFCTAELKFQGDFVQFTSFLTGLFGTQNIAVYVHGIQPPEFRFYEHYDCNMCVIYYLNNRVLL